MRIRENWWGENEARFLALCETHTASQVAAIMTTPEHPVTRNMVIGKARRLRVSTSGDPPKRTKPETKALSKKAPPTPAAERKLFDLEAYRATLNPYAEVEKLARLIWRD